MSVHIIPELDARGLRNFALTTSAIVIVLFAIGVPWLFSLSYPVWPWILAAILSAWGLIHAPSLKPVYRAWMKFGLLLNRITTPLILGIVFFLIFTPVALVMRLFGRDTMQRKFDPGAGSYRKRAQTRDPKSMENPF